MLRESISDRNILNLLWQYLKRTVEYGNTYRVVSKGISLGCSLSPLMGALYLRSLDALMQRTQCAYVRFMDDWAIIVGSRSKLRRIVRVVNQLLNRLKVEKHPQKTYIGKSERGIEFLGVSISTECIEAAPRTLTRMFEKTSRLYEQGADNARVEDYLKRWRHWARYIGLPLPPPEFRVGLPLASPALRIGIR